MVFIHMVGPFERLGALFSRAPRSGPSPQL